MRLGYALVVALFTSFVASSMALAEKPLINFNDFMTEPPVFTRQQALELERIQSRLIELTDRLFDPALGEALRPDLEREADTLHSRRKVLQGEQRARERYERALALRPASEGAAASNMPDALPLMDIEVLIKRFIEAEKNNPPAAYWEVLGLAFERFSAYRFRLNQEGNGHIMLRLFLLQGKCYLNASVAHYHAGRERRRHENYVRGLEIIERVARLGDQARMLGTLERIDHFPGALRLPGVESPSEDQSPVAGPWTHVPTRGEQAEQALVGIQRRGLRPNGTYQEALQVLADYCPWGLELYRMLYDAGYMHSMNFQILHPYHQAAGIEQPPKLSVHELPVGLVPDHIKRDIQILAGGAEGMGRIQAPGQPGREIRWVARSHPSYKIWFLSPAVFDMKPSEMLEAAINVLDIVSGSYQAFAGYIDGDIHRGLREGFAGYIDAWLMEELIDVSEFQRGPDDTVHAVAVSMVTANQAGIDSDLLDWDDPTFNWTKLVTSLAGAAFKWIEEQEVIGLFEGLAPETMGLGLSKDYADKPIPPVLIRSEFFGFEETEEYEYNRSHRVIRYYTLDPRAVAAIEKPYHLSRSIPGRVEVLPRAADYLAGQVPIRESTWPGLPGDPEPFGLRHYVVDFSPASQTIRIDLDPGQFDKWQEEAGNKEIVATFYDARNAVVPQARRQSIGQVHLKRPGLMVQFIHEGYFPRGVPARGAPSPGVLSDLALGVQDWLLTGPTSVMFREAGPGSWSDIAPLRPGPMLIPGGDITAFGGPGALPPSVAARVRGPCAVFPLTTKYLVRITAGERELAEIPIQFTARGGKRLDADVSYPMQNAALLVKKYQETPIEPIALTAARQDLFSAELQIGLDRIDQWGNHYFSAASARGKEHQIQRRELPIAVYRVGTGLQPGYHRVSVNVGERQYTLWGHVDPGDPGFLTAGNISVPAGRSTLRISADGLEPIILVLNNQLPSSTGVNLQQRRERMMEMRMRYQNDSTGLNRRDYALEKMYLARDLSIVNHHREAASIAREVLKLLPEGYDASFWQTLYDIGFHTGDRELMLHCGVRFAEVRHGEKARSLASRRNMQAAAREAERAIWDYTQLLRRWVSVGGEADRSETLYRRILELWGIMGYPEPPPFMSNQTRRIGVTYYEDGLDYVHFGPGERSRQ